jgi:hypothetical protein
LAEIIGYTDLIINHLAEITGHTALLLNHLADLAARDQHFPIASSVDSPPLHRRISTAIS